MTTLVAVDPGGVHVGVTQYSARVDRYSNPDNAWTCDWSREMHPQEFEDFLSEQMILGQIDILVVEEWVLFGDLAAEQTGSDMPTSQLIGVIKYIHRMTRAQWPGGSCDLIFQPPTIKIPTRSLLRSRKVKSWAKAHKVTGDHVLDAELHASYHILHTLEEDIAS